MATANIIMTKAQLFALLTTRGTPTVHMRSTGISRPYILQSIQREDGSGRRFNITLQDSSHKNSVFFVKTID